MLRYIKTSCFIIKSVVILIGCLIIGAWTPISYEQKYYIPIDNQTGNALPLSKKDIIRVVISHKYFDIPSYPQTKSMNGIFFQAARNETTDRFKELGYDVIDAREHGYELKHPTVIALVESSPIEQSESQKAHIDKNSIVKDIINPTIILSEIQTYYYKVTLIRPKGEYNSLFYCLNSNDGMEFCVEPAHTEHYQIICSLYATLSTNSTVTYKTLNLLTKAVFYQYPNIIGKKWVYFTNSHSTYATKPHPSEAAHKN